MPITDELVDKFDYISKMSQFDPRRVKFVGEKKMKCSFSGNEYYVVIFCGTDQSGSRPAVYGGIGGGTIDATAFSFHIGRALASGWLQPNDVLVMNKAKIHTGGDNSVLEDYLWNDHRVYVQYLPAATPKWTPVTAVWKDVSKNLRGNPFVPHGLVMAADIALSNVTHSEMWDFYAECYAECGIC